MKNIPVKKANPAKAGGAKPWNLKQNPVRIKIRAGEVRVVRLQHIH